MLRGAPEIVASPVGSFNGTQKILGERSKLMLKSILEKKLRFPMKNSAVLGLVIDVMCCVLKQFLDTFPLECSPFAKKLPGNFF